MEQTGDVPCPICEGTKGKIVVERDEGVVGFLYDLPPSKYARYQCLDCGCVVRGKGVEDMNVPDEDLRQEVRNIIEEVLSVPKEEVLRIGRQTLLKNHTV